MLTKPEQITVRPSKQMGDDNLATKKLKGNGAIPNYSLAADNGCNSSHGARYYYLTTV